MISMRELIDVINEAFDTSVPVDWEKDKFGVSAHLTVDGHRYHIDFEYVNDDEYEVCFSRGGAPFGGFYQDYNDLGTTSPKLFSAIGHAVLTFLKQEQPVALEFSGRKTHPQDQRRQIPGYDHKPKMNRFDIYLRMLQRVRPQLASMGYSFRVVDESDDKGYLIIEKMPQAAQDGDQATAEGSAAT